MLKDIVYIKSYGNYIKTSAITTIEFLRAIRQNISNILIIKGDVIGNDYKKNFELINGYDNIIDIISNTQLYGNMSFVDCCNVNNVDIMSKSDIAQLLYAGHMFEPYSNVSVDAINNKWLYCSHDNGFISKVYFKNTTDMIACILNLMYEIGNRDLRLDDLEQSRLLKYISYGILIDGKSIANKK